MSRIKPPRFPAWMLEHLNAGKRNDALNGDLVEEFRRGRSVVWYWRQVLAALLIGWVKNVRDHRNLMVFTALWSILAPGWTLIALRAAQHQAEAWHIWQLNWPWSSLCSVMMFFAPGLIFIWLGMAFYLVAQMRALKHFNLWWVGRGLLLSMLLFIGISCVLAGSVVLFPPLDRTEGQQLSTLSVTPPAPYIVPRAIGGGREVTLTRDKRGVATVQVTDRVYVLQNSPWPPKAFLLDHNDLAAGTLSWWDAITKSGVWAIVGRLPFFLSILLALWTARRATSEDKGVAG